MSDWINILVYPEDCLWYGTQLRCKGGYPYEERVDFLLCDLIDAFAFIVCSGYKAGSLLGYLPKEAFSAKARAIDTAWLKENWSQWGYSDCPLEEVYVLKKN